MLNFKFMMFYVNICINFHYDVINNVRYNEKNQKLFQIQKK
jgi:hypothetical protein